MSPNLRRTAVCTAATLSMLAGANRAMADFTFSPYCNNNWYGECSFSPGCPAGGFPTYNNWWYNACTGGLPLPGAGDAVHLGNLGVVINGNISIASMDETAGASINWAAGDISIGSTFQNVGSLVINAGNVNLTANIVNSGSITEVSGYSRVFHDSTITNLGSVEFQNGQWSAAAGQSGQFNSSGSVAKTTGGNMSLYLGVNNTGGLWDIQAGAVSLNNTTVQSTASTTYTVRSGGGLYFNNDTLSGTFFGANDGAFQINGATLGGNVVLNMAGGGVAWQGGDLSLAGHTLTNQGLLTVPAGNVGFDGAIINQGNMVEVSGYSRVFRNASVTNALGGVLEWQALFWSPAPGLSGTFTNNGTVNKTTGSGATISTNVVNNGAWHIHTGTVNVTSDSVVSTPSSSYSVDNGASLTFSNLQIAGTLAGTNSGTVQFNTTWSLSGDLSLNMTGNGVLWSGGDLNTGAFTLTNHSPFTITAGNVGFAGAINNLGTLTEVSGYSRVFQNASITNGAGGTVDWQSVSWVPGSAQTGQFTNNGTVTKTTGGGANVSVGVTNNGAIHVLQGAVNFASDLITASPSSSFTVDSGGSMSFNSTTLSGTFAGANSGSIQAISNWSLGTDTTLNFSGNGFVWFGGDFSTGGHTLTNRGLMSIAAGNVGFTGAINNLGTLTDTNSYVRVFYNSTITNAPGGTVNWQGANWQHAGGQSGLFTNNGIVTKTTGDSATLTVDVVNNGPFSVQAGPVNFSSNTWTSSPGANYTIAPAGSISINATSLAGTFNGVNNGSAQAVGNWSLAADTYLNFSGNGFVWTGGTLDTGTHTLFNQGIMAWNPGNIDFNGTVNNSGILSDSNGYSRVFHNASIVSSGTVEWQSVGWYPAGSQTGTFTNSGTVQKTTGGTANLSVVVNNTGFIDLIGGNTGFYGGLNQSAGLTRLDGGGINGGTLNFSGGRFDGNGNATATVFNTGGIVAPGVGAGAMSITGDYTQGPAGKLEIELAGTDQGTTFDHLNVSGAASINGTITVRFLSGYNPAIGTTFRVLDTSGTMTGTFANIALADPPNGKGIQVNYDTHGATLVIVQRCGGADFNCDGDVGTDADIEAFFSCLAGSCPPPPCTNSADFNADGDVGTDADIESFFRVLAGGHC